MGVVDSMRVRLLRATELGVPSDEFLKRELDQGLALKSHLNLRVAQAGQETENAVHQLEYELDTPDEAIVRLAMRQAVGD